MSITSVSVFGNNNWEGMTDLAGGKPCYHVYCWPWHMRIIATVLTVFALISSIVYECRTKNGEYIEPDEDDKVVIVPVYDDESDGEGQEYGYAL